MKTTRRCRRLIRLARCFPTAMLLATGCCGVLAGVSGHGLAACCCAASVFVQLALMILADVLADRDV